MPNAFYGIVSGLARPSDFKNLEKSQERKLDEIVRLLDRLIEIEEENFRRRWGEDFKPKSSVVFNHPLLPPNNTNKSALPIGTTTTTTTTRNKGTLPLDMKEAEDNTKG